VSLPGDALPSKHWHNRRHSTCTEGQLEVEHYVTQVDTGVWHRPVGEFICIRGSEHRPGHSEFSKACHDGEHSAESDKCSGQEAEEAQEAPEETGQTDDDQHAAEEVATNDGRELPRPFFSTWWLVSR
jgi:hypothetical protein